MAVACSVVRKLRAFFSARLARRVSRTPIRREPCAANDALAAEGPVLVDVRVTQEENVYPMIAPGAAARDMVG